MKKKFIILMIGLFGMGISTIGIFNDINQFLDPFDIFLKGNETSNSYKEQLKALNSVENSLKNLESFIHLQKSKLNESERIIKSLEEERNKLKPLVEADQKIINAMFAIQEERKRTSIWIDRGIGFLMGISSSLIASLIWGFFTTRKREKH